MSLKDFHENADDFGFVSFNTLMNAYENAKTADKETRQETVGKYLAALGKLDYSAVSADDICEAAVMTTNVSTWAKRGELRKQAINKTKDLFILLSGKQEYTGELNEAAEIMIKNNKPTQVEFFKDYCKSKEIYFTAASLKFEHLTP